MHMHTPQRLANINLISTSGYRQVHPQKLSWLWWAIVGKIIFLVQRSIRVPREKSGKVYVIWQLPNKMLPSAGFERGPHSLRSSQEESGGKLWHLTKAHGDGNIPRLGLGQTKCPLHAKLVSWRQAVSKPIGCCPTKSANAYSLQDWAWENTKENSSPKEFMSWRRHKACTYIQLLMVQGLGSLENSYYCITSAWEGQWGTESGSIRRWVPLSWILKERQNLGCRWEWERNEHWLR